MHWLPMSVGRKRAGKFKHAGIFLHDPVPQIAAWKAPIQLFYHKILFLQDSACIMCSHIGSILLFVLAISDVGLADRRSLQYDEKILGESFGELNQNGK